ncbi:hypothetical protein CPB84DRAFT_1213750 [Gymnopilus junonius]|uniref:Fungal-type protein kinase domain-containing protein n=1 Tax=Gymnopilus junonius TaxID=109634 RepID=A0A9P5N8V3_GYMJU|nr:hypothetical protein CPB84DRAFT_1213750 [Gymnopilus junonius]
MNQASLGDMEFTQTMSSSTLPPMRTGSLEFMSIEAIGALYVFLPNDVDETSLNPDSCNLAFVHNPLHDLESLWWIFIHFLFHFIARDVCNRNTLGTQIINSMKMFPDSKSQAE